MFTYTNFVSGAFEDGEDYRIKHVDKKTEPYTDTCQRSYGRLRLMINLT